MKARPKYEPFTPGWTPPSTKAMGYITSEEFQACHEGPKQFVVDGLLALNEFSVVFGDPDAGKGNFATTLACAVAGGQTFFGRQAGWLKDGQWLPGGVLYCALERHTQVLRRITAYEREHGAPFSLPIAVCTDQFDIRADDTADLLIETLYDAHQYTSMPASAGIPNTKSESLYEPDFNLIIIDTLAMALQGGSDSDPGDMGRTIHTIKRVMAETDAHVMLIHHSPVSGDGRMRGYGSLNAAIDVSIRVEQKKAHRVASVVKNSDDPNTPRFYYSLKSVDVPQFYGDNDGDPVGEPFMTPTPILVEMDAPPASVAKATFKKGKAEPKAPTASPTEEPVYEALASLSVPVSEKDWRAAYDANRVEGISDSNHRTRFSRGKKDLAAKGLIRQSDDGLWSVTVLALQTENCNSEET